MNRTIKTYLAQRPKLREWVWFAALWLGSLSAVLLLGYSIKFFMGLI